MPITIGSNIASLGALRQLTKTSNELGSVYERLSSGMRINKASDDAAGVAIADSLRSDRRVFNQGIRNFNDGISLLNIADGAIENLSNIVIRLKELAEQSANGTYSATQRKAIDKEAQALSKEYTRIAQSTKFNGKNLLDGSLGENLRLQGGFGVSGGISSSLGGAIGTGSFSSVLTYSSTAIPGSLDLETGDLNGDGYNDIVVTGGGTLEIRLGQLGGTFESARTFSLGAYSGNFTLGDVNNDGKIDIVLQASGKIGVGLGTGEGTFSTFQSFSSIAASDFQLSDVNNDGALDLIAKSTTSFAVSLGSGSGSFGAVTTYQMEGGQVNGISIADLNGDGLDDVVTTGSSAGNLATASIRLGNGDGTFSSSYSYQTLQGAGSYGLDVKIGDMNGDGILDLVTNGYNASTSHGITVQLGRGDGTFGSATSFITDGLTANAASLAIGDLNGDGHLDIISLEYSAGSSEASILIGTGNGTFNVANTGAYSVVGAYASSIVIDDLNSDGVLDFLAVADNAPDGIYSIFFGQTKSGVSSLLPFDLKNRSNALDALSIFDKKIQQLAKQRGQIGAFQSRVQVGISNLQSASENYAAAESRIRDADIAEESSKLLRLNILQQSAASILSQTNLQPQMALKLLRT